MSRWMLIAVVANAVACDECDEGASRCDGRRRLFCVMPAQSSGAPSSAHWEEEDCGRPDLCITDPEVGAFCAIRSEPETSCPDDPERIVACAGADRLTCEAGYPIGLRQCLACEEDGSVCRGGYGDPCVSSDDCVAGLGCLTTRNRPTSVCTLTCVCRDFAYCDACRLAGDEDVYATQAPMCDEGVCVPPS
jgi:hypothetical protein